MRKIYSILLIACSMLISANIQAVNVAKIVGGSEYETVKAAFDAATTGQTIQLIGEAAEVTQTECIILKDARVLTLDLNGKTLTFNGDGVANPNNFVMLKGNLTVKNGTVKNVTTANAAYKNTYTYLDSKNQEKTGHTAIHAFLLYGSGESTNANWTTLTIEATATVDVVNGKAGIAVDQYNSDTYGVGYTAAQTAYGVVVNVYGTVHGEKYGIQLSGNVKTKTTDNNIPLFHIYSGAVVYANPTASEAVGAYAAGYGHWIIEGYVHGSTGLYVKGGSVEVKDAKIKSDNDTADGVHSAKTSGVDAGGNAIVTESNGAYAGKISVEISGTSEITAGAKGYAVQDTTTTSTSTYVETVVITGGTFTGGAQGCITLDEDPSTPIDVTITGGNYSGNIDDIVSHIQDDNKTITPVDDGKGGTVYVVSDVPNDGWEDYNNASFEPAANKSYNLVINSAVPANTTATVDALKITGAYKLIVPSTSTLKIGQAVLGADAQIEVMAGGRLIIEGENGIVSGQASNIILHAMEGNNAKFLLNPNVKGNMNPMATIEFVSKSYYNNGSDYRNQRFGIPANGNLTSISVTNDIPVAFAAYVNGTWTNLGRINSTPAIDLNTALNEPFVYYQMSCNLPSSQPHPTITMTGNLVGNKSPLLTTSAQTYTTFANSYMGNLALTPLYDVIDAAEGVDKILYTYKPVASNTFVWKGYNRAVMCFEKRALEPMQAFYVKNNGNAVNLALNYETMVWNSRDTEFEEIAEAPARAAQNMTVKAQMSILSDNVVLDDVYMLQGQNFSTDYEDGWDAEKRMNDDVNFYVMDDIRQETFATSNLHGTYLGFACENAGTYTVRFTRMSGAEMVLVDLISGAKTEMVEGATYTFRAEANDANDYRFLIVTRDGVTTDIENVENTGVKAEGIYTITGQYVGNMSMWNTLPAGIYVVDGVKKVK
jgi:hypothetical protein